MQSRYALQSVAVAIAGAVSLVSLAAGCSCENNSGTTPDAGDSIDAPGPDAETPNTVVRLVVGGSGLAGASVWVESPTGELSVPVVTNADGEAGIAVTDGDSVSALAVDGTIARAITWRGALGGEQLVWHVIRDPGLETAAVTVDAVGPVVGASSYAVVVGECFAEGTDFPIELPLSASCLNEDGDVAILGVALGAEDIPATAFVKGVAIAAGGNAATLGAFTTDTDPFTFSIENLPADYELSETRTSIVAGELEFEYPFVENDTGGSLAAPAGFSDFYISTFRMIGPRIGSVFNGSLVFETVEGGAAETVIDATDLLLPAATEITRDDTDPARPVFAITYPSPPPVNAVVHFFDTPMIRWVVIDSGSNYATAVLPGIPASLAPIGDVEDFTSIALRSTAWDDYDEARRSLGRIFDEPPVEKNEAARLLGQAATLNVNVPRRRPARSNWYQP